MKTKLLGAVGACVLALTVGTANASTFYVDGTFLYSTVTIFLTIGIILITYPTPTSVRRCREQ